VQKGETLNGILHSEYVDAYSSSPSKVKEFFLKANKDHIKDEHKVIEGQKLTVPALPAGMFESVHSGSVALDVHKSLESKVRTIDSTPTEAPNRKAPGKEMKVADKDSPSEKEKSGDGKKSKDKKDGDKLAESRKSRDKDIRIYEVQSKDNLTQIAREQLGSETLWKQILKMNPGLDPAKMRPGMKVKLPAKRPMADTVAATGRP
jgi:nucleoid-associated protein YgaU